MALNNIFREPRREIIETIVGVVVVGIPLATFLYLDYWFAVAVTPSDKGIAGIVAAMVIGVLIIMMLTIIVSLLASIIHSVGESICDAMDRRDVYLRPRNRRF